MRSETAGGRPATVRQLVAEGADVIASGRATETLEALAAETGGSSIR